MIQIYADTASINEMREMHEIPAVSGYTTNPTLMRKAGVTNYEEWARSVSEEFPAMPISFEVIADTYNEMNRQARKISSWGENIYVKIPVTCTTGESTADLIGELSQDGIKVNITAVFTQEQIDEVFACLSDCPSVVSVFAGRIADTGRDPTRTIRYALNERRFQNTKILWASTRQVLDVYLADILDCDIITCTPEIIRKLKLEGKNLLEYSLETVKMFRDDSKASGYRI